VITIWPVAHFFWGYSIFLPVILILIWLIKRDVKVKNAKEFLKKRLPFGIFGGLWAMIPDVDYFLDENMISTSSLSDVFFFHISLDKVLPETDLFFAGEMLLIFAIINLFVLAATVESFKRLNEALFGRKEEEDDEEGEDANDGEEDKGEDEVEQKGENNDKK
jgi:hypothetical protein